MEPIQIRTVELTGPEPITEGALRRWSQDFSLPTVVRGAFEPPPLDPTLYLPADTRLFANLGQLGGFNHTGNGSYTWEALWAAMASGQKVYGAFGTGTNNLDPTMLATVLRFKKRLLPSGIFPQSSTAGHVIFGASDELGTTTGWHCAIGANLVFQLAGEKLWWSSERLPSGYVPLSIGSFVHAVGETDGFNAPERAFPTVVRDRDPALYDAFEPLVLRPGDLLINPPFSWHAVRIDQRSITLSIRGDRNDALAWVAYRYFDGDFEHPLFVSLCNFFWTARYIDEKPPIPHEGSIPADDDPNRMRQRFFARAQQYRAQRQSLAGYARRYEGLPPG